MGASCTGKDTIMKELTIKGYEPILSFTDRPIRDGEKDGVEYYFKSPKDFDHLVKKNKLIECRTFKTTNGLYRYGTPKFKIKIIEIMYVLKTQKVSDNYQNTLGKKIVKYTMYLFQTKKEKEDVCLEEIIINLNLLED